MLHGSQKRFDKNGDGKLTGAEWQRWYWRTFGDEIEAKERRRRNQAAEQQRAEIAAQFVGRAVSIINWMWRDLEHLEGEREDQDIRTMQLALYVISAAMQTQKVDESMRYLLRAFWQHFQPTLGESVYQALCAKQLLFEEYGVISEARLGSFWKGLLDELPPERRVGKDADLQELLNDASRLYNYFGTAKIDFAELIEPYWAAIRLPEETEEPEEYDEDEEPEEESEPWTDYYGKPEPAKKSAEIGYYQFCAVQFKENGRGYTYLTGGISLKAGDFVMVPVGRYGAEKLARVTDVFVCSAQDAPYPPEKAKFVLRKAEQTAFPEKPKAQPAEPVKEKSPVVPVQIKQEEPPAAQPVPATQSAPVPQAKPTSKPEIPKKHVRIPWKGLLVTASIAAVLIFAFPPLLRTAEANRQQIIAQQAEEEARREARKQQAEADRQREEAEREAAIQTEKDAGIPYVGMPESSIDSTRTLGLHGLMKSGWAYTKNQTIEQKTYIWFTSNRTPVFTAVCQDGKVVETQKANGYWNGNELLVAVVKPEIPTTFSSGSTSKSDSSVSPGSTGLRDEYDSPEDLYEDNPGDYEDEDEAWDAWEND